MSEQGTLPGFEALAAEDEQIGPEEARRRSVVAREAFEELIELPGRAELSPLRDAYLEFWARGWGWRKALFIAWKRLPRKLRWPEGQAELARMMGLESDRTIRKWRYQNPEIDREIQAAVLGRVFERTADVIEAAFTVATCEGYKGHNDRKMLLEMGGLYRNQQDIALTTAVDADKMAEAAAAADAELGAFEQAGSLRSEGGRSEVELDEPA